MDRVTVVSQSVLVYFCSRFLGSSPVFPCPIERSILIGRSLACLCNYIVTGLFIGGGGSVDIVHTNIYALTRTPSAVVGSGYLLQTWNRKAGAISFGTRTTDGIVEPSKDRNPTPSRLTRS